MGDEQISLYFNLAGFHCFYKERHPSTILVLRNEPGFEDIHPQEIVIDEVMIIGRELNVIF